MPTAQLIFLLNTKVISLNSLKQIVNKTYQKLPLHKSKPLILLKGTSFNFLQTSSSYNYVPTTLVDLLS